MNQALLWFLFRRHRLTLGLLLLVPILIGWVIGLLYPQLRENQALFESLPFIKDFFKSEFVKRFSAAAIFTLPWQHPLCLITFAVFPAVPILGLPAGERGRGSLDLILATPLERKRLITVTALFALLGSPLLLISCFLGTIAGATTSGDLHLLPLERYPLAGLNAIALSLFWAGAALVISVASRDRPTATLVYSATIVVAFALDSTARIAKGASWLSRWSPYGYFRPADTVGGSDSWWIHGVGLLIAGVLLLLLARELQQRRRSA